VEKKVKVKASFVRAGHLKDQFKEAKCALPISVGQPYHEGEKFKATIELINKNFKECVIIVCDSLQRHTLAIYDEMMSEQELHQKAIVAGDQWVERNLETIKRLKIPYQIRRWDEWLLLPEYREKRQFLDKLHREDASFKEALNNTANMFLERITRRSPDLNKERILSKSLEYIKEECVFDFLWLKEQFSFEIYPKPKSQAKIFIYQSLIKPYNPKLIQRLIVRFRQLSHQEQRA
jgi:tRNA-dependent cyclodipeptide synthase